MVKPGGPLLISTDAKPFLIKMITSGMFQVETLNLSAKVLTTITL
jgi:hypothetical protein